MAIDFPASPALNDEFVAGGITYVWNGQGWTIKGGGGGSLPPHEHTHIEDAVTIPDFQRAGFATTGHFAINTKADGSGIDAVQISSAAINMNDLVTGDVHFSAGATPAPQRAVTLLSYMNNLSYNGLIVLEVGVQYFAAGTRQYWLDSVNTISEPQDTVDYPIGTVVYAHTGTEPARNSQTFVRTEFGSRFSLDITTTPLSGSWIARGAYPSDNTNTQFIALCQRNG